MLKSFWSKLVFVSSVSFFLPHFCTFLFGFVFEALSGDFATWEELFEDLAIKPFEHQKKKHAFRF